MILLSGSAWAKVVRDTFEGRMRELLSSVKPESAKSVPQDMLPENMGAWSDWVADAVAAGTTLVGPVAGLAIATPVLGSSGATVVNVAGFLLSIFLFAYVLTQKGDIARWSRRYKGWLSPVVMWGLAANALCAAVSVVIVIATGSPQGA